MVNKIIVISLILLCFSCQVNECRQNRPLNDFDEFGRKHGTWSFRYSNGELQSSGDYSNGKRIGTWTNYDNDGKVMSKHIYKSYDNLTPDSIVKQYFSVEFDSIIYETLFIDGFFSQQKIINDTLFHNEILGSTKYTPIREPNWNIGAELFSDNCSSCHRKKDELKLTLSELNVPLINALKSEKIKEHHEFSKIQLLTQTDAESIVKYLKDWDRAIY